MLMILLASGGRSAAIIQAAIYAWKIQITFVVTVRIRAQKMQLVSPFKNPVRVIKMVTTASAPMAFTEMVTTNLLAMLLVLTNQKVVMI